MKSMIYGKVNDNGFLEVLHYRRVAATPMPDPQRSSGAEHVGSTDSPASSSSGTRPLASELGQRRGESPSDRPPSGRRISERPESEVTWARRDAASGQDAGTAGDVLTTVDGCFEELLSASARSEANLHALQRALQEVSRCLTACRRAQEDFSVQQRHTRLALRDVAGRQQAWERYAELLVAERDAALAQAELLRAESDNARRGLIDEQDRFIQVLLDDHETELDQLRQERDALGALVRGFSEREAGAERARSVPGVRGQAPRGPAARDTVAVPTSQRPAAHRASAEQRGRESGEGVNLARLVAEALSAVEEPFSDYPARSRARRDGEAARAAELEHETWRPGPPGMDPSARADETPLAVPRSPLPPLGMTEHEEGDESPLHSQLRAYLDQRNVPEPPEERALGPRPRAELKLPS